MSDLDDLEAIADSARSVPRNKRLTLSDKFKDRVNAIKQRGRAASLRSRALNSASHRKVPITLPPLKFS